MKIALITICVYSLILTVVNIYKDESSYSFGVDTIDLIVGGPILWLTFGFIRLVLNPIYAHYRNYRKKHPREKKTHLYTDKQIARIAKKVMKAHLESCREYKEDYRLETFSFVQYRYNFIHHFDYDDNIILLNELPFKTARYEWLNRKYNHIYNYQFDSLLKALAPYFEPWTVKEYEKCDFSSYWIQQYKNEQLWRIK